jgi:hypothetical protein
MPSDVYYKVEDLCKLDLHCNFDAIATITIFCTVVLSVIQGISLNTGVLPFSKGRALQEPALSRTWVAGGRCCRGARCRDLAGSPCSMVWDL